MSLSAMLAGVLAGSLSLFELFNSSRKSPAFRAYGWILVLFGFDATSGLIAYILVLEVFKGLTWFVGVWPVVLAGLCGPALVRSQLALLGSGQESSYYGPAVQYRRLQKNLEQRIDRHGAEAQSDWVAKAIPRVAKISIDEVDVRVTNYVKALASLEDDAKQLMLDYFEQTLTDGTIDDSLKYRYIVQKLIDNDCRQCVKSLLRRAKEL